MNEDRPAHVIAWPISSATKPNGNYLFCKPKTVIKKEEEPTAMEYFDPKDLDI